MTTAAPLVEGTPVVPGDVLEFLRQLSVGLHRYRAYPSGHPTLESTIERTHLQLGTLLDTRETLALGVSRHHLIVDGVATDAANRIYSELAERMYRRQIGALVLRRGATQENLRTALRILSREIRTSQDVTIEELADPQLGSSVSFLPFDFAPLSLADGETGAQEITPDIVLLELAQVLLGGDMASGKLGASEVTPDRVAAEISARVKARAFDSGMTAEFLRYAKSVRDAGGPGAIELRRQLRSLVGGLTPGTLAAILSADGSAAARRRVLGAAVDALPSELVMDLVNAAASSEQTGISHALLRLLRKLSVRADGVELHQQDADSMLRETVHGLIDDWTLVDPNPPSHTRVLQTLATSAVVLVGDEPDRAGDALLLIQIALETGSAGDLVREAVEQVIVDRSLGTLLGLLSLVSPDHATAQCINAHLVSPEGLQLMFAADPIETAAIGQLLPHVPLSSASAVLDALLASDAGEVRQMLLARVRMYGDAITPIIIGRLPSAPPPLLRHLLSLLRVLPSIPDGIHLVEFAQHADPLVRREGLRLMLAEPSLYDEGINIALTDPDERILRFGLTRVQGTIPRPLVPKLLRWVSQPSGDPHLKAEVIKRLGELRTVSVRDWMLESVVTKGSLLRKRRLATSTPQVMAALQSLAQHWRADAACQHVFELMARNDDAAVRSLLQERVTP